MTKTKHPDYLENAEALKVLSANTDHAVDRHKISRLAADGEVRTYSHKGRTQYNREDVERIFIRPKNIPKQYALVMDNQGETRRLMVYTEDGETGYIIQAYRRINVERLPNRQTWVVVEAKQEQLI